MSDKQCYLYKLIPPRPSFFADQTDDERAIMARHVEYWAGNLAEGKAVALGPGLDPGGVWGSPSSKWTARRKRTSCVTPIRSSGPGSAPSRFIRCPWRLYGRTALPPRPSIHPRPAYRHRTGRN